MANPNIMQFYGVCLPAGEAPILVMEQLTASVADAQQAAGGVFRPRETIDIVSDVASGLHYLHDQAKVRHSDVRPTNIMLTDTMVAKLIDLRA